MVDASKMKRIACGMTVVAFGLSWACQAARRAAPLGGFCSLTCGAAEPIDAGQHMRVTLVTTLRDSVGDPLPAEQVVLTVLRGKAVVTPPALSDDAGRATGSARLPVGDVATVQAWAQGPRGQQLICGSVQLSFAGDASQGIQCAQAP